MDIYPRPAQPFTVTFKYANCDRLIGHHIPPLVVKQILAKLEIKIKGETADTLQLEIPPFKVDVTREADVIEEVLRIYGFNNVPFPDTLRFSLSSNQGVDKELVQNTVANYLAANGFHEIMVNSITNSQYMEQNGLADDMVRLLNSLNMGLDSMRTSTIFGGLEGIGHNINRRNLDVRFFEFGKTYHKTADGNYQEPEHLSLFITGQSTGESWKGKQQPSDFFLLKSQVEHVCSRLGESGFEVEYAQNPLLEYGLQYRAGQKILATYGLVSKKLLKQFDIKQDVYFADLNWTQLLRRLNGRKVQYKEVSKFPGVRRDLALLLDKAVSYAEIEKIALREVKKTLKSVNLFDRYEDAKLGAGKKSYAVSFEFQDEERTLTDKDVEKLVSRLVESYKKELGAEIRQ